MQQRVDDAALREALPGLGHRGRQPPPALHLRQVGVGQRAGRERRAEEPGGRDRVLHGQVDADPTDRRHRVRGVADQQCTRHRPLPEPVQPHGQQPHVVPARQLAHPIGEVRRPGGDAGTEGVEAGGPHLVVATLGDHVRALEVVAAVDAEHQPARADPHVEARGLVGPPGDAEPEHVHRRAELPWPQAEFGADHRPAAVAADSEPGPYLAPVGGPHAGHPFARAQHVDHLGRPQERERRQPGGLVGEQVEEIPLRQEEHVRVRARQPAEVGDTHGPVVEGGPQCVDLAAGPLCERGAEADLVEQVQRGRMDGVAPEVPQEVGVLLQHDDVDTLPREQQPEHDSGGPATHDTNRSLDDDPP